MKWLFFILLLINLSLLLLIYPQQQVEEATPVIEDVGKLTLASELKQQNSIIVNSEENDGRSGSLTEAQSTQVAPLLSKQEKPEVHPPLLTEKSQPKPESAKIPELYPQCVLVGPVETQADAEQIAIRLRALGLKPDLQTESHSERAGFWVLIPPQANRSEAIKMAKRLEKSGVSDLWRFTSGDLLHAISLGMFQGKARATIRKREIDALGFNSEIYPRYREITDYWLRYRFKGASPVSAKDWSGLVSDYPGLTSKTIECS
jgi:hypothetical protein